MMHQMYFSSSILLTSTVTLVSSLVVPFPLNNSSSPTPQEHFEASSIPIVQQNVALSPPLPILEIGLQHIMSQIGDNMTQAETEAFKNDHRHKGVGFSSALPLRQREAPVECSPTKPCVDGSCCNSVSDFSAPLGEPFINFLTGRKVWLHTLQLQKHSCDSVYFELRRSCDVWCWFAQWVTEVSAEHLVSEILGEHFPIQTSLLPRHTRKLSNIFQTS